MDKRPALNKTISWQDFKDFYWLKKELVVFGRSEGLSTQGGKIQIAQRIENYLKTGKKENSPKNKHPRPTSKFDWNGEALSRATVITDNYKNTENVRAFFQTHLGPQFKFSVKFMRWMKQNQGKPLAAALEVWRDLEKEKKKKSRKVIAPQFEYNRYLRDFLENNPNKTKQEALRFWKIKRSLRGDNKYNPTDLDFVFDDEEA